MNQTAFVLGAVAVRNVKIRGVEVLALTGSEAFKSVGSGKSTGQFSELRCIVQ